jgi:hypothetical protein
MEPSPPSPHVSSRPPAPAKRRYVRRGPLSEAALEARRANLRKARAAPKSRVYRPSEKRRAASRANLRKAIAARKSPQGNAHARLNALRHGLNAKLVRESVARLAEDPREFAAHLRGMERFFAPENELERQVVRQVAETLWKRLRLCAAQARLERERLAKLLAMPAPPGQPTVEELHGRARAVAAVVNDHGRYLEEEQKLAAQVERGLRAFLLKRSGGKVVFRYIAARHDPDLEALEQGISRAEMLGRWLMLTPEQRQALVRKAGMRVPEGDFGEEEEAGFSGQVTGDREE